MPAALDRPMPPPWLRYPFISQASIGWRMGFGETYSDEHAGWLGQLSAAEQARYRELFPAPASWRGYDRALDTLGEADKFAERELGVRFWRPGGQPAYNREQLAADWPTMAERRMRFFWRPSPEPRMSLASASGSHLASARTRSPSRAPSST